MSIWQNLIAPAMTVLGILIPSVAEADTASDADTVAAADAAAAAAFSDDISSGYQFLFCLSNTGGTGHVLSVETMKYKLMYQITDATNDETSVVSTFTDRGRIIVDKDRYVYLSEESAEVGSCVNFTENFVRIIGQTAAADPAAFRAFAKDIVVPTAEWKQALKSKSTENEAELLVAKNDLDIAQSQLMAAKIQSEMTASDVADMKTRLAANDKEQNRLKLMICKLNPAATFQVCKDGGN